MPISLKLFYCLCLAIASWLLWQVASLLWFPSPEHIARIAAAPEDIRHLAPLFDAFRVIAWGLQAFVLLILASLIVFARQGWLRYLLAGLVALRYGWPAYATLTATGLSFSRRWEIYTTAWWQSLLSIVWLTLWALVVVLMFLPDAKAWFRRTSP